ncbi:hypothetical protein DAI22_08g044600 [Oryza sativa Japonica Group]|nr:hypothetical protein DAI22_08g044600 [Oryza sativa Japonica Group]
MTPPRAYGSGEAQSVHGGGRRWAAGGGVLGRAGGRRAWAGGGTRGGRGGQRVAPRRPGGCWRRRATATDPPPSRAPRLRRRGDESSAQAGAVEVILLVGGGGERRPAMKPPRGWRGERRALCGAEEGIGGGALRRRVRRPSTSSPSTVVAVNRSHTAAPSISPPRPSRLPLKMSPDSSAAPSVPKFAAASVKLPRHTGKQHTSVQPVSMHIHRAS